MKKKHISALLKIKRKTGGRNNQGRITVRHIGGGNKRKMRIVDYKRNIISIPAKILFIQKDPSRKNKIALVAYAHGILAYILLPENKRIGDIIYTGTVVSTNIGNHLPIKNILIGSLLHNIEVLPGQGGKIVRAAGTYSILLSKNKDGYAILKLPSGELKRIQLECYATIGGVSLPTTNNFKKNAGFNRNIGKRPSVRGVAMNPVDHPHGGGEGKSGPGRPSVTFKGIPTKGKKTRKNRKSSITIIKSRHFHE